MNTAAIPTSSTANTRYRVASRARAAHDAPTHAPATLPISRLATTPRWPTTSLAGTTRSRAGTATSTTNRLIALFTITASRATNPKIPINSGSRNSAPPRPTSPPTTPTAAPAANARPIR